MTSGIDNIISTYNPKTQEETKAIIRETLQSIILIGLSKGGFFEKASFYGGTALRILYGLNRYSEDLDFTLNNKDESFSLESYIPKIIETGKTYGLDLEINIKEKSVSSNIESAFLKINTFNTYITLKVNDNLLKTLHKDEVIKIKFEIDCNPSTGFNNEVKWIDMPEYAKIVVLDKESLFSGKLHAILCRDYKNNVKGRDYYDFLFYTSRKIKPNLNYLKNKLVESGKISKQDEFNSEILKNMLKDKFESVDFDLIKNDVEKFVLKNEDISYFSKELFIQMLDRL